MSTAPSPVIDSAPGAGGAELQPGRGRARAAIEQERHRPGARDRRRRAGRRCRRYRPAARPCRRTARIEPAVAVKSSVRPGSASVCLVVESGGRRCCSAAQATASPRRPALLRPSGPTATVTAWPRLRAARRGELASSARAPLTQHMTTSVAARRSGARRRETKSHAVCSLCARDPAAPRIHA